MFCGLDFGTSHCATGVMQNNQVNIVPLFQQSGQPQTFMPSTLYAFDRGLIPEYIKQILAKHSTQVQHEAFLQQRQNQLSRSAALRHQHDLMADEAACFVGQQAIDEYIEFPEEGYFVKSPKSFLGASGLQANQLAFFEDLVTAMMLAVKQRAESHLKQSLTQVVIGRPVNFQGINGDKSNQQAIEILTAAATRCGYADIEFLFEPLAAGIDFESNLTEEKLVLVVDIGGGTTDCSVVKMSPERQHQTDRQSDFLAHTGKRVGGNDLDIHFAFKALMPLFGLDSTLKNGKDLPLSYFWNAVATNDVVAQAEFVSQQNANALDQLSRDAAKGELIKRLIKLQKSKQNHRLVRNAEQGKIALSDQAQVEMNLAYIEAQLATSASVGDFADAIRTPLQSIQELVRDAVKQAGCKPDMVYLTGGSAKSAVLRNAVIDAVKQATNSNEVNLLDGDYFGSVTAGLTKWAGRIFA